MILAADQQNTTDPQPRRVELILRQVDALPTLPAVAARLLQLTSSDDSDAKQVTELVATDPSLTAKILKICRAADKGVHADVITIDRAVVLLGFNAVRNAVLSIKVFELFEGAERESRFDRQGFWLHCLAVAVAAERLAPLLGDPLIKPEEAFVCGLLHDIGKLAMDTVLPKAFARCVELAEINQSNLAEAERRVIGLDHHTAGKRLAEQWKLPHRLGDCIWLHGSPPDAMPDLEHKKLVMLISLADAIARKQHIGYSGNHAPVRNDDADLIASLGLDAEQVSRVAAALHDEVEQRGQVLGVHDKPSRELFQQSIQSANAALGRLNASLERRSRASAAQGRVLDAISRFHAERTPGQTVQDVIDSVVQSAEGLLGNGYYAVLFPGAPGGLGQGNDEWLLCQYNTEGQPIGSQYVSKPPFAPDLSLITAESPVSLNLMGLMPWLSDYALAAEDLRQVQLVPLASGWGTVAILMHDRPKLPPWNLFACLASTWGSSIASAGQHEGARRLGEELAQANTALAEAQDRLLRHASMARLGEMAAGAAHEMNNPLAVISGRSQLLAQSLEPGTKPQQAAMTIYRESHRLSDLITSLHLFADPPKPKFQAVDLGSVIQEAVQRMVAQAPKRKENIQFSVSVKGDVPPTHADPELLIDALSELLTNASQANPKDAIQVVAQLDAQDFSVLVKVIDDGDGMDQKTLDHAVDPFFSSKAAGRRVGMGLTRANQLIGAHGGELRLRSSLGQGTVASLSLPLEENQTPTDATPRGRSI